MGLCRVGPCCYSPHHHYPPPPYPLPSPSFLLLLLILLMLIILLPLLLLLFLLPFYYFLGFSLFGLLQIDADKRKEYILFELRNKATKCIHKRIKPCDLPKGLIPPTLEKGKTHCTLDQGQV